MDQLQNLIRGLFSLGIDFFLLGIDFFLLSLLPLLLLLSLLPLLLHLLFALLLLLLLLPCFLASVLHWSFKFLSLHLFRSSCCLVASCEFLAAFAACVVILFLRFLFNQ